VDGPDRRRWGAAFEGPIFFFFFGDLSVEFDGGHVPSTVADVTARYPSSSGAAPDSATASHELRTPLYAGDLRRRANPARTGPRLSDEPALTASAH